MHRTRRASGLALVIATTLLLLTACAPSTPSDEADQKAMDAIAQEIQATLAKRPDVVEAKAGYQNNLSASQTASVNVKVKAGTEFGPVIDEALRLVWLSNLKPLGYIRIGIIDAVDLQRGETRDVDTDKERTQLEAKYGPRPK